MKYFFRLILIGILGYCSPLAGQTPLDTMCPSQPPYYLSPLLPETEAVTCTKSSAAYIQKYRLQTQYIPNTTSFQAIKTIPVNIVVFGEDDGTGFPFQINGSNTMYFDVNGNLTSGFQTSSPNTQYFHQWINHPFVAPAGPYPVIYDLQGNPVSGIGPQNPCSLPDTRVRFLIKYYFYENSTLLASINSSAMLQYHFNLNPEAVNQLTCILSQEIYHPTAGGFASSMNYNGKTIPYVHTRTKYYPIDYGQPWGGDYWYTAEHLPHEFGHHLQLDHTYNSGILNPNHHDYLDDVHPDPQIWPGYFGSHNLMGGAPSNDWISCKQMGRMHRTLSIGSLTRHFAFGYGSEPHLISSNETWDFEYKSYNDIIVESGAILTITCRLEMVPQAKIIVEPGARLIIDGGIITSARCGGAAYEGFWQGIEVWGNYQQSQIPIDAQTGLRLYQGEVQVINGGTIENAINAIAAIKTNPDGTKDWSKTGGVIILDDANMKNNNFDVWIGAYHNKIPNTNREVRNYSSIVNSRFEKNDNMLAGYNGYAFIGLWDVGTISIKGNSFKNLKTNLNIQDRGRGIVAYSATINLTDYCPSAGSIYVPISQLQATSAYPTPCTGAVRNHFEGLYYGVWASNVTGLPNSIIHIDRANFEDVYHGIYIQNAKHSSVTRCDFEIPSTDPAAIVGSGALTHAYGIYLDGSDGYRVEENNLFNNSGPVEVRGIVVNESGVTNNEIYRNTLESTLGYAIQAQGNNRGGNQTGLGLFCNEMAENLSDIVVLDNGIKVHQLITSTNGSSQNAAGNIFTSCVSNNYQNYNNQSAATIFYYADGNNVPQCVYNVNFPQLQVALPRSCPSKLANTFQNTEQNLGAARLAYNSAVTMLHIWQDGGNANLEYEVETTLPWEVYVQFNELMLESPYLSDEAILAAINNDAFSSLMIKLLMAANTHAVHNPEIMEAIYQRIPAMPESYIAEIESGFDQVSQLDLLRGDVAATRHLVDVLTNDIKRHYQMEFEDGEDVIDEYINFVASINTLTSRYDLASLHLQVGDYTSMAATLESIPFTFELNDLQEQDHLNWQTYFDVAADLKQSGIYPESLTAAQITELETIAELEFSRVAPAAKALLMLNQHGFEYKEEVKPVPEYTPRKRNPESGIQKAQASTLKVYPNPCNDFTTLEYRTGNKYNNLRVELTDAMGKTIFSQRLKGGDNEELLSLSTLKPGVYLLKLIGDNAVVDTQRITISR